jgi:hypothetical protein
MRRTLRALPTRDELERDLRGLDETARLLADRWQRVLTAMALTLEARQAIGERLTLLDGDMNRQLVDVAPLEVSAARFREIVKALESA